MLSIARVIPSLASHTRSWSVRSALNSRHCCRLVLCQSSADATKCCFCLFPTQTLSALPHVVGAVDQSAALLLLPAPLATGPPSARSRLREKFPLQIDREGPSIHPSRLNSSTRLNSSRAISAAKTNNNSGTLCPSVGAPENTCDALIIRKNLSAIGSRTRRHSLSATLDQAIQIRPLSYC